MLILGYRVYMDRYSNSLCYKKTKNDRGHEAHRPRFRWPGSYNLSDHNRQFELPFPKSSSIAANNFSQHVNRGCILINDEPVCQNYKQTVAVIDGGMARFRARFNGNDKTSIVAPGCTLDASWPSCYQDIFFGADNCLYDAGGKSLHVCVSRLSSFERLLTFVRLFQAIASTASVVLLLDRTRTECSTLTCDDSWNEARKSAAHNSLFPVLGCHDVQDHS